MADGAIRNMVIFGSLLYGMKMIDQTDPVMINYCRMVFAVFVLVGMLFHAYVTRQITMKNDTREIEVPPESTPFAPAATTEPVKQTVMEYDMAQLNKQRTQMLMSGVITGFLHFKMGQVTPLVLQSVMGLVRLLDDPMFKLHVLGNEATGALERPFKAEPNPIVEWMMGTGNNANTNATEAANNTDDGDSSSEEAPGDDGEARETEMVQESESTEPKKTK